MSNSTLELPPASSGASPLTTKGDVYGFSTVDARIPVGSNGQVLTADSAQTLGLKWSTVSGTGDVVGPSSATDNAVTRFDGTTGKLIQDSLATVNDQGTLINPTFVVVNKQRIAAETGKNYVRNNVAFANTADWAVVSEDPMNPIVFTRITASLPDPSVGTAFQAVYPGYTNSVGIILALDQCDVANGGRFLFKMTANASDVSHAQITGDVSGLQQLFVIAAGYGVYSAAVTLDPSDTTVTIEISAGAGAPLTIKWTDVFFGPSNALMGPSSSVDNTIPRFDGTTGKLLQDSSAVIDDAGNLSVFSMTTLDSFLQAGGAGGFDGKNWEFRSCGSTGGLAATGQLIFYNATDNDITMQLSPTGDLSVARVNTDLVKIYNPGTTFISSLYPAASAAADTTIYLPNTSGTLNFGDVVGPAGATDNAVARWDTGSGKLLQDSTTYILDSGSVGIGVVPDDTSTLTLQATGDDAIPVLSMRQAAASTYGFDFGVDDSFDGSLHLYGRQAGTHAGAEYIFGRDVVTLGLGIAPATTLDVNGVVTIRGGSPSTGAALISTNGTGTATWGSTPAADGIYALPTSITIANGIITAIS